MINKELLDYVYSQKAQNMPSAAIRANLHMIGKWTDEEITQALINPEAQPQAGTSSATHNSPVMAGISHPESNISFDTTTDTKIQVAPVISTSHHKELKIAITLLSALLIIGGAYMAYGKLDIFSNKYYQEDNLLSGLMAKSSLIKSATYTSSIDVTTSEKDPDTKPFPTLDERGSGSDYDYSYFSAVGSIHAAFSAEANWEDANSDMRFNVNVMGDMGDLTYKANIDGIKKGEVFYIKINNFPSLFFFDLSKMKNQWIKLTTDDAGFLSENIGQLADEVDQEDSKREAKTLLIEFVALLEKNKFIGFSKNPKEERVGSEKLVKYSLNLNRDALITSYLTMYEKYKDSDSGIALELFGNESRATTMNSNDFRKLFDYYLNSNGALILWTDIKGSPVNIEYIANFLASDDSEKQVNVSFKFEVSGVNKSIVIEAPDEAKTLEEVMEFMWSSGPLSEAREKGNDAKIKAHLAGARTSAEIYYDNNNGYGISTNSCSSGMFTDTSSGMNLYIDALPPPPDTQCHSNGVNYAVTASLTDGYWCVDSQGASLAKTAPLATGKISCQ